MERQRAYPYTGPMAAGSFPILFITATRIGDAVLSSGLVRRLADEIPNARFTIVAGPVAAPLFLDVPNLDDVIVFEKSKDGGHWFKLWRQVRHKDWGLIVDMRGSAISGFLKRKRRAVFKRVAGPPVHKVVEAARVLKLEGDPPAPSRFCSSPPRGSATPCCRRDWCAGSPTKSPMRASPSWPDRWPRRCSWTCPISTR